MTLRKTITTLAATALLAFATPALAQSEAGDRMYQQGTELQKTRTKEAQQQAIEKFEKAKKLYDSKANKNKCDQAIAKSQQVIKELSAPAPRTETVSQPTSKPAEPKATITFTTGEQMVVDRAKRTYSVGVATSNPEHASWTVEPMPGGFATVKANPEQGTFDVTPEPNPSAGERTMVFIVRTDKTEARLTLVQQGTPPVLEANKNVVAFSKRGGTKALKIYSNAGTLYTENNKQNWRVDQKPDWITVVGQTAKEKSDVQKRLIDSWNQVAGSRAAADDPTVTQSIMQIVAEPRGRYDEPRTANIVIVSGSEKLTIVVQQK